MAWVKDEEHTEHWRKWAAHFEKRSEDRGITARRVEIRDREPCDILRDDQINADRQRQESYREMVRPNFRPESIEDLWLEVIGEGECK